MDTAANKPDNKAILNKAAPFGLTALLCILAWGLAGCGSVRTFQIESRAPEHQIVVDGKADDWAGHLFVVEGQKVSLGFLNDRDFLYVCLRTDDTAMERQFLRSGLMIWFDPKGGKKKTLGIRYPVGLTPKEMRMWRGEERGDTEQPGEFEGNLSDLEVFRQGQSEPESLDIADAEGIEIKASTAGKHFVYELRMPLASPGQNSLGLGAQPGGTIGIGFETGKIDLSSLSRRPSGVIGGTGGMPPAGAFGGFGGRGGMGRPGRLRPNEPQIPEELKVWATVLLSLGDNHASAEVQSLSR
jgi:hypothetical protein